jgi:hypothetical protein
VIKKKVENIKPLNNRIEIDSEESLVSYIYRLSSANHFETPQVIGDMLDVKRNDMPLNIFNEKASEGISVLSGRDFQNIYSKSYHSFLKTLDENQIKMWFLRSKIKYCPECISEKKIHKFLWGIKPVSLCTKHFKVLINSCQNCNRQIQISSLIKGICKYCNYQLELAKAVDVKEKDIFYIAQRDFQKLLLGGKNQIFREISIFNVISIFDAIFRLFDGFESFLECDELFKGKKILTHSNDEIDYTVSFTNAYWMLFENFPENLYRALDTFYKSDSPRKKYRKRQFTNFLSSLEEFTFVKEEFEKFKDIQITNGLVPRNLETFDLAAASKLKEIYFNKRDIVKAFDISRVEIDKLCDSKILNPRKVKIENHTNFYFNKRETEEIIRKYLDEKKDLITKKDAATILGVGVGAVTHLIERGVIEQKKAFIKNRNLFVSKKSIDSLFQKLSYKVKIINEEDIKNFVSLEKSLDKYATYGLQIGIMFYWAISNQIKLYSTTKEINIKKVYLNEVDLKKQLYKEDTIKNGYNLADVSKVLSFTERTLHKMINAKLITPVRTTLSKNGRRIYFFDTGHIEEFKEKYITAIEAALKYEVNYSTLNNFSHKKILKNYLKGVCQKVLFKKEELEEVLIKRGFIKEID